MRLKNATLWKIAGGSLVAGIVLAACSGGSSTPNSLPIPPPNQSLQSMLGSGFAAAFNRSRIDEPTDPVAGDVIAINLATDPLDVPDPT
jgi:hypothetical protein